MSGKASGRNLRSRPRYIRANKGIAFSAAAVLGQLYQWRPDLKRKREGPREPGRFDVQAVFDALNKR